MVRSPDLSLLGARHWTGKVFLSIIRINLLSMYLPFNHYAAGEICSSAVGDLTSEL